MKRAYGKKREEWIKCRASHEEKQRLKRLATNGYSETDIIMLALRNLEAMNEVERLDLLERLSGKS